MAGRSVCVWLLRPFRRRTRAVPVVGPPFFRERRMRENMADRCGQVALRSGAEVLRWFHQGELRSAFHPLRTFGFRLTSADGLRGSRAS